MIIVLAIFALSCFLAVRKYLQYRAKIQVYIRASEKIRKYSRQLADYLINKTDSVLVASISHETGEKLFKFGDWDEYVFEDIKREQSLVVTAANLLLEGRNKIVSSEVIRYIGVDHHLAYFVTMELEKKQGKHEWCKEGF